MGLQCECSDEYAWYYEESEVTLLSTKRSRKCCSCTEKISIGDDAKKFSRWRYPEPGSIAAKIYGEDGEEPLSTWYMCDRCAGLYESLAGLGFCSLLGDDMRQLAKDYAQMQRDAGIFRGDMRVNTDSQDAKSNHNEGFKE